MDYSLKFLQGSYALAIAVLLPFVISTGIGFFALPNNLFFLVMVVLGLIVLGLGLFRYSGGLSLGLMLGGIRCVASGSMPYWVKITQGFRFIAALVVLLLMLYAWYRWSQNNKGK